MREYLGSLLLSPLLAIVDASSADIRLKKTVKLKD